MYIVGQVSMMNHCIGQAEACFRAIINNIVNGKNCIKKEMKIWYKLLF